MLSSSARDVRQTKSISGFALWESRPKASANGRTRLRRSNRGGTFRLYWAGFGSGLDTPATLPRPVFPAAA